MEEFRTVEISPKTRLFIAVVAAMGLAQLAASALSWPAFDKSQFFLYFLLAAVSSLVRFKWVGCGFSLGTPFVLMSIVDLSPAEAVLIGCGSVLIQAVRSGEIRANSVRLVIAVTTQATVIATCGFALSSLLPQPSGITSVRFLVGSLALFVANTLPVAIALRLSSRVRLGKLWKQLSFWSLPYYFVCGALAIMAHRGRDAVSLETSLVVLPLVFLAYRYYRQPRAHLETQEEYADRVAALHLRAIEGLALAVEAKDNLNTKGHLRRVQVYSLTIGKEMGLEGSALEALHAGSLLHDIGKLAVPDHILTKPGKLTPEEFAKMKVHPLVGAEIVEQVQFPHPVAPIVRAHHEKWDGSGYPYGLKGREIPIGARILAAVDCLDALTSDREYRKGIPLDEAIDYVASESGRSFDPEVVKILRRQYRGLDRQVTAEGDLGPVLSTEVKIDRGSAPDAGLDFCSFAGGGAASFCSAIAAAHRETKFLRNIANSLSVLAMHEVLPDIHRSLQGMIPHDAIAFFLRHGNTLRVEFSSGVNSEELSHLEIPMGKGLTGWVAERQETMVNGNPAVDPGFLTAEGVTLQSALSTPLVGRQELIGVLSLYRSEEDAFTRDELAILTTVTPNIALAVENALKYRITQELARIDSVTGLPNSDLFLQYLEEELARAAQTQQRLCVLLVELFDFEVVARNLGKSRSDESMAAFGRGSKDMFREHDRVGRVGPASFAVALPSMPPNQLRAMLTRIDGFATSSFSGQGVSLRVGAAFFPEDGESARYLLSQARNRAGRGDSKWTESIQAMTKAVKRQDKLQDKLMEERASIGDQ